jgi:integrase
MSVKIRRYRKTNQWEADIRVRLADGSDHRERSKAPGLSRSGAQRWAQDRERHLLQKGPELPKKEVPTLEEFTPRFMDGYARANRQKPSGIAAKETILNVHLVPVLGAKKLDAITNEDVQRLKRHLAHKAVKTVNNVLTVLNTLLKTALEWELIERLPCTIRLLPTPKSKAQFHDFDAFERLVAVAERLDHSTYLIVLLGGEAGLRCGEMMALEWRDVDLENRQLTVERSDWKGHVTSTKGGRVRFVRMTRRLTAALRAHRHLRGARVLCRDNGEPLTQKVVQDHVRRAARRAKVVPQGVHVLRHTFCSHLAMCGAPARAIQELAGHQDLGTTQRYMHVSPAAIDRAIQLLDDADARRGRGEMMEKENRAAAK